MLVDQPDPALLLKFDRLGRQGKADPVNSDAVTATRRAGAREGRRSNAPARDTANYVKHAEQRDAYLRSRNEVLIFVAAFCVTA